MKQLFITFCLCSFLLANNSCIEPEIKGSGTLITQDRPTATFNAINLSGIGNVFVEKGSVTSVQVITDDNIQEHINISTVDNLLVISTDDNMELKPTSLQIYVVTPHITDFTLSGSGTILTNGILTTPKVSATLSGSGKITLTAEVAGLTDVLLSGSGNVLLSGSTYNLNAKLTGDGNIKALSYPCHNATVLLSGKGNIEVAPTDSLTAILSGSGDVRYIQPLFTNLTNTSPTGSFVVVE